MPSVYTPVDYPELNCLNCKKLFKPKSKRSVWCSIKCRTRYYYPKPEPINCGICDVTFTPIKNDSRIKYCSLSCKRKGDDRLKTQKYYKSSTYRLNIRMRSGLRRSIGKKKAGRSWEELVGFTRQDLQKHIERQFTTGMDWQKFFSGEIHIDHIMPLSSFDFESAEDDGFKRAWSLPNLRPMWAKDNMRKGAQIRRLV